MVSSLTGPCSNPACIARDNASGQFQKTPPGFCKPAENNSGQVCKKAECLRWAGLKEEKKKPGRPSKKQKVDDDVPTGVPISAAPEPRPPIVHRIDEIWSLR